MVIVLVAGVGGVFVLFALMALCYRYDKDTFNVDDICSQPFKYTHSY